MSWLVLVRPCLSKIHFKWRFVLDFFLVPRLKSSSQPVLSPNKDFSFRQFSVKNHVPSWNLEHEQTERNDFYQFLETGDSMGYCIPILIPNLVLSELL